MVRRIGMVFLGHGTRLPQGISEFHQFTKRVQNRVLEELGHQLVDRDGECPCTVTFTCAFLELVEPNLISALKNLQSGKVQQVLVCPVFLFAAGHMKIDIPALLTEARVFLRDTSVELLPAVGIDPHFVEVVVQRLQHSGLSPANDAVLLLGRGNQDRFAQANFELFAQQVAEKSNFKHLQTGYLTGTGRNWRDTLDELVQEGFQQVFIQPYLWFHGWLSEHLPEWVLDWRSAQAGHASMTLQIGQPLGVEPLLVESVAKRVGAALFRSG